MVLLRHFGELSINEGTAKLLVSMSAATIDRRLAPERAKYRLRGRVGTKPGSLLNSRIPVRTWAEWDDARHDGGNRAAGHAFTLTVPFPIRVWTPTTNRNSSTTSWPNGAKAARSPSPGRGREIRTTTVMSSRRIGRWSAPVVGYHRVVVFLLVSLGLQLPDLVANCSAAATTRFHRAIDYPVMTVETIAALTRTYSLPAPHPNHQQGCTRSYIDNKQACMFT